MPQRCCAANCCHTQANCKLKRFPADRSRAKQWEMNMKRHKWKRKSWDRLCECHFETSQFELRRQDGLKKLIPFAIPTIFESSCSKVISQKRRHETDIAKKRKIEDTMQNVKDKRLKPDRTVSITSVDHSFVTHKKMIHPELMKSWILNEVNQPVIISKGIETWKCLEWTMKDWANICGEKLFQFRIANKTLRRNEPLWEGEAVFLYVTLTDFLQWLNNSCKHTESLAHFPRSNFWCYSSYNYMSKMFCDHPSILKDIDWSPFGFQGRCGEDSTWWIGNEGAHTPCHQDTYGCNLVAQVTGRKLWILFPPEDTEYLYPTRIPYEESSVFSSVNVQKPDLKRYPNFQYAHPHCVILEPSQVLYVPPLWWHYVECLEPSISINTWIELETDDEKRLEEAVAKMLLTALIPCYEPKNEEWVNVTEDLMPSEETVDCVSNVLKKLNMKKMSNQIKDVFNSDTKKNEEKITVVEQYGNCIKFVSPISYDHLRETVDNISCLKIQSTEESQLAESNILNSVEDSEDVESSTEKDDFVKELVKCLTHPDVISVIANKVKDKFVLQDNFNIKLINI